jgi:cell volume regulation protein A
MTFETLLLGIAVLLVFSVIASKASGRLGVPALLLFLAIGIFLGTDGPGGIYFEDAGLVQRLGTIALIFILFSGGMDTDWAYVRPALKEGIVLATAGTIATAALVGVFAVYVLSFSWLEGLLLGAIVSSTDAAAVFAILRSRGVGLQGKIKPLVELESGSNDPMAVFLTTMMVGIISQTTAIGWGLFGSFILQMVLGVVLGLLGGYGMVRLLNRINLEYEGLYPVLTIGLAMLVYSVTGAVGGNGFLAIYIAGLVMGNTSVIHRRSLLRFHDGLAWLMQIAMFLTLGLLVTPSRLVPIAGAALSVSVFLILVARPLSVFLTLAWSPMPVRAKALVGWVGLRGAVPIILATFPLLAGLPQALLIFDLVFFIVLTSVLIQGSTIPLMARLFRVEAPLARSPQIPLEFAPSEGTDGELMQIGIDESSPAMGKRLVELGLPPGVLVVLVGRDENYHVPSGATQIQNADTVLILARRDSLGAVKDIFGRVPLPI